MKSIKYLVLLSMLICCIVGQDMTLYFPTAHDTKKLKCYIPPQYKDVRGIQRIKKGYGIEAYTYRNMCREKASKITQIVVISCIVVVIVLLIAFRKSILKWITK